jgi:crotonobetainyl-CoA:carnitine CoA-transferase CaiB-like acyl-CoA transferase
MINSGIPEREPVSYGTPTAVYYGGSVAAAGTVGALIAAQTQGIGQHVDVSIMECLLGSVDRRISALLSYQYSGDEAFRESMRGSFSTGYFPCQDGYFCMAAGGKFMFPRLVKMMGNPEPLMDPRFLTTEGQRDPELQDLFEAVVIGWSMNYTKKQIAEMAAENGLICAAVNDMKDVAEDPHFNVRGAFSEIEHPVMGQVRTIGRPFMLQETPWQLRRPAPLLGQHNAEVYGELGYTQAQLVRLRETGVI